MCVTQNGVMLTSPPLASVFKNKHPCSQKHIQNSQKAEATPVAIHT